MQRLFHHLGGHERLLGLIGLFFGMAVLGFSAYLVRDWWPLLPWIAAPLGASAFIIYIEPHSRFARPWAVIAGNLVAGLVAVSMMHLPDLGVWALPLTVSAAVFAMALFGALHPPASAVALLIASGHVLDYRFVFFPVTFGAIVLVGSALVFSCATPFCYPQKESR